MLVEVGAGSSIGSAFRVGKSGGAGLPSAGKSGASTGGGAFSTGGGLAPGGGALIGMEESTGVHALATFAVVAIVCEPLCIAPHLFG